MSYSMCEQVLGKNHHIISRQYKAEFIFPPMTLSCGLQTLFFPGQHLCFYTSTGVEEVTVAMTTSDHLL